MTSSKKRSKEQDKGTGKNWLKRNSKRHDLLNVCFFFKDYSE